MKFFGGIQVILINNNQLFSFKNKINYNFIYQISKKMAQFTVPKLKYVFVSSLLISNSQKQK
jgi:hypothetical protein